jgi:HPt (histidine-containing phosphotransfer) domain-containing protein
VGKPFDLEQLIGTILRHARAPKSDGGGLNQAAALARLGGNRGIYAAALRAFPGEMDKLKQQFATAREQGDAGQACAALHQLRALAGMVGADRLAALAGDVEADMLAATSDAALAPHIDAILMALSAAEQAVSAAAAN